MVDLEDGEINEADEGSEVNEDGEVYYANEVEYFNVVLTTIHGEA